MIRNFTDELKQFCLNLKEERPMKEAVKKFNIHKRSLPIGVDKVVVFNVTYREAELILKNVLKAKMYANALDDTKTIIYYDAVPVDAKPRERSIFYNSDESKRAL